MQTLLATSTKDYLTNCRYKSWKEPEWWSSRWVIHKQVNDLLKFCGAWCEYLCTFFWRKASCFLLQSWKDLWHPRCSWLPGWPTVSVRLGWGVSLDAGCSALKMRNILGKLGHMDHPDDHRNPGKCNPRKVVHISQKRTWNLKPRRAVQISKDSKFAGKAGLLGFLSFPCE